VQHRAVGGFDGDIVGRGRIVELGPPHVGSEAVHDLERAGIVDAEVTGGIGKREFLVGTRFERPAWFDHGRTHFFG